MTHMRIESRRTLVKSKPELGELLADEQAIRTWLGRDAALEVTMAEKGFGTEVVLRAEHDSELCTDDLERVLDGLAEPHRRPFSA